jgi:N-acetylglucosamine kinase-like BadF-type ATPase
MAVIAGTGSVVASRGPQGTFKSGGGGPLLGDYGSAFYVGKLAVYHTLVSAAPYEASPAFAEACRELFGSDEPAEVMASIYREPSPAWKVAKLAPTVAKDYERGEQYAKLAVETSSAGLAKEIGSHAKRHGQREQPLRICLAGGLWSISPLFKQLLQQQLEDELEVEFELVKPVRTPLEGSVRLAREISTE